MSEHAELLHAYQLAERDLEIARLRLENHSLREQIHDLWPKKQPAERDVEQAAAASFRPDSDVPSHTERPRTTKDDQYVHPRALSPEKQKIVKEAIRAFPDAGYAELKEIAGVGTGTIARYKKIVAEEDAAARAEQRERRALPTLDEQLTDRSGLPPYTIFPGQPVEMGAME